MFIVQKIFILLKLEELLIRNVMKIPAFWTEPHITATEAATLMLNNNIGALPIIENGKLIGIDEGLTGRPSFCLSHDGHEFPCSEGMDGNYREIKEGMAKRIQSLSN